MSSILTVTLDDETVANLQAAIGTLGTLDDKTYVKSSKAIKRMPGYNEVEIFIPMDGRTLIKRLGILEE